MRPDNRDIEVQAALVDAWSEDQVEVQKLEIELKKDYPLDTRLNAYWVPAIDARIDLGKCNPPDALRRLQAVPHPLELGIPIEAVNISCLYPVYTRSEAYLAGGQGNAATGEFQKILDHPGIVQNCATGASAHLGLARAYALEAGVPVEAVGAYPASDRRRDNGAHIAPLQLEALAKARIVYQDFFALWKDADPILKQAKAEYARVTEHTDN